MRRKTLNECGKYYVFWWGTKLARDGGMEMVKEIHKSAVRALYIWRLVTAHFGVLTTSSCACSHMRPNLWKICGSWTTQQSIFWKDLNSMLAIASYISLYIYVIFDTRLCLDSKILHLKMSHQMFGSMHKVLNKIYL